MKRLNTRQKIRISGYYLDDKTEFSNYVCIVNDCGSGENEKEDSEIFYYFNSWKDVDCFMVTEKRTDTEFVITKVKEY